jgi:transcriptional regulator with XRE-family HTH domain
MGDTEQIQINCKRFREEADMTQQAVAEATGMSIDVVRAWEQKRRKPELDSVVKLAKLYGRRIEEFFMPEPPPAARKDKPAYAASFKITGSPPPGLKEELEAVLRKYNPEYAHKQARIKKQLHRR